MRTLQNDFTTTEQSKRLLELGVLEWTANWKLSKLVKDSHGQKPKDKHDWVVNRKDYTHMIVGFMKYDYLPCWSVGRLIEIYNMCVDFDLDDGAAIVIFIQDESPIVQMMQMFEDKVGIMDFSKLED